MKHNETTESTTYYYPVTKLSNFGSDFERTRAKNLEAYLHVVSAQNIEVVRTTELRYGDCPPDWPDLYTQMCVDITRLVFAGRVDTLVLLVENRSLIPAMVAARAEGVRVELWHGPKRTADLHEVMLYADKMFLITEDLIQAWRRAA